MNRNPGLIKSFKAESDIPAYRIVKFGTTDDHVDLATSDADLLIGVTNDLEALVGESVDVVFSGLTPVRYGGVVARGAFLTSDSQGRAVASGDGDRVIGFAWVSGASGDIGSVCILPSRVDFGSTITASAAELNALDGAPFDATFVVGAEAGNVINIGIQLQDAAGADLATRTSVFAYFSDDANGDSVIATAPSGAVAIGTDGVLLAMEAKKTFRLISEADGDIDINITEAGAKTLYLVLVLPNGKLKASPAITFA